MKIAILITGHLRTWKDCKQNFINSVYNHNGVDIDIYIRTYKNDYRTDYAVFNENNIYRYLTENEIYSQFDGIKIKSLDIVDESLTKGDDVLELFGDFDEVNQTSIAEAYQMLNIIKCYEKIKHEEQISGKYDLIIKTRFDLLYQNKLDYDAILQKCLDNPKLICASIGGIQVPQNDLFAITNSEAFDLYATRFLEYANVHPSMTYLTHKYGIIYDYCIPVQLLRPK